ncbi:MAG TPA: hypothetical protein H9717_09270 [Candidatus Eisenbergiella merdipullorum]|uniref:Uncharacterized protein n=1 Tax=Candidatus Eisenbergiella merdipullorum TaxID=2838553 RepID=A0A9D2L051_9FIRM|nr:hypothetical protein [Candidatus Eisenbergiella merdipullorum]
MDFYYEIPASFWSLFRSVNRDIYIESLLAVNDEYQYNNYFLSREACLQVLSDLCMQMGPGGLKREEEETEEEAQEAAPGRILNRLLRFGWLRRVEDYSTMTANIVIPDYASIMIEAFERLASEPEEDTQVYIQNVYATLFSFKNDARMNLSMLKTALVNTRKLNRALQDMLHNMDRFFAGLLEKQNYGELLQEHLKGYVEEVVERKYHILKTSDNFYIYKTDICRWLQEMREDTAWLGRVRAKQKEEEQRLGKKDTPAPRPSFARRSSHGEEDVLDLIDQIERGFEMIERRIASLDREHSKYIRATLSRLNYLLSGESDRHGLLVQLLNRLGEPEEEAEVERRLRRTAEKMNLASWDVLGENAIYRGRHRRNFMKELEPEEKDPELSREEILKLNRIHHRFTRTQVEEYIEEHMENGCLDTGRLLVETDEDFEKLILAYDLSIRRDGRYEVLEAGYQVQCGPYTWPAMMFIKRKRDAAKTGAPQKGEKK